MSTLTKEQIAAISKKIGGGDQIKRKADDFPPPIVVPDAALKPLFDDKDNNVWTVEGRFPVIPYIFYLPNTMTIYRDQQSRDLTLFNAFRLNDQLEKEMLGLGKVTNVVKLGQFHGDADAYYTRSPQFGSPKLWTLPEGSVAEGTKADFILSKDNLPIKGAQLYELKGHFFPESLMTVPCSKGNLLIGCDSLIHMRQDLGMVSNLFVWMMGLVFMSEPNIPKPAPFWTRTTVEALGADPVLAWYRDIVKMKWTSFVGGHGAPAYDCDHDAVYAACEKEVKGNVKK